MCASTSMVWKERMRRLWVRRCCARANRAASASSQQRQTYALQKFERNLRGMQKIAFVTNLTVICNWFLSFCALTWASAVLLGAYVTQLSTWDYYDVSLLLFIEGIRFGLAATLRLLGYRLSDFVRWALRSVSFFLPLGMGGFAVLSMLPLKLRHKIHLRLGGHSSSLLLSRYTPISHAFETAAPPPSYRSLSPSLDIFYILILSNAFVLLLGNSITGLMRQRYVRSTVKSLCKYYDKMINSSTSWLRPAVDLRFAFEIQASQYRKGRKARYVCENYADLICYLYIHEKGVEAAEAALVAEDGYMREAAAHIVGFWAVLDTFEEVKEKKQLPLCFQRGMLSKLADIAAESYGSLGTAAARSFTLLLELVDPELIGMVVCVSPQSSGKDLIDVLLGRTAELLHPHTYKLPSILQKESHAHIYALRQYLLRLRSANEPSDVLIAALIEAQRVQIVKKIKDVLPQLLNRVPNGSSSERYIEMIIQSLDDQLALDDDHLAAATSPTFPEITACFKADTPPPPWKKSPIKASFLLLFNLAFPLLCLGIGFILNALL